MFCVFLTMTIWSQGKFLVVKFKKREEKNKNKPNNINKSFVPNLFLLSSSAMSCLCCLLASREQGRSVGTLCCWACRWNQARDITWHDFTSGWCHRLPYLISHRRGIKQTSHQSSIKTCSKHKQVYVSGLERSPPVNPFIILDMSKAEPKS